MKIRFVLFALAALVATGGIAPTAFAVCGTRPYGGLKPTTPFQPAGMRIEPPMSEPVARVDVPDASEAPAPPEEPPAPTSGFHGFRVTPQRRVWVNAAQENSGAAVRACGIAPAASSRSAIGSVSGKPIFIWRSIATRSRSGSWSATMTM